MLKTYRARAGKFWYIVLNLKKIQLGRERERER